MSDLAEINEEMIDESLPVAQRRAVVTRNRILDAAEYLFGHASPDTVSLRDISARARVALGLVHHHFRNKESLIEHVVARRATELCEIRRQRLRDLETRGAYTPEDLVDAFCGPLFERLSHDDEGWRAYVILLSQLAIGERWRIMWPRYFEPTALIFLDAFARVLPDVSPERLRFGFDFAIMCMINMLAQSGNEEHSIRGPNAHKDPQEAFRHLRSFACAGLRGMAD